MPINTKSENKTADGSPTALQGRIKYYFVCACGCGQISDFLDKDSYVKLRKNQRWYSKECSENKSIVKEFKNGNIVKEEEF